MKTLLTGLLMLVSVIAWGAPPTPLSPLRHNFFTTNPAPIVDVVAGSNATVQATLVGADTRRFTVNSVPGPTTNFALLNGTNTFTGTNTFNVKVIGDISGNAATATTATNLDGFSNTNFALLNGTNKFTATNLFTALTTFSNNVNVASGSKLIFGGSVTAGWQYQNTDQIISMGNVFIQANASKGLYSDNISGASGGSVPFVIFTGASGALGQHILFKPQSILVMDVGTNSVSIASTTSSTNGFILQLKPSFTTNFTCTTNLQVYCANGTNQLITLPNAARVPGVVYRFTSTNGFANYTITNATGGQTIRDGVSLSHKQVGVAPINLISDGAHWFLTAKDQTVNPNAQFSCTTNVPMTLANTEYAIPFNSTDFNNSQGIALAAGSQMWITNSGQYEFTPSIVYNMGAVSHTLRFWFKTNGVNVANSTTPIKIAGNGTITVTVAFLINIIAATYVEIFAESDGTGDKLLSGAAAGNYPASPSIICPVKRISDTWP